MTERVDIREPLKEICRRLGVDYGLVAHIDLFPRLVRVELFRRDHGRIRVDDDGEPIKNVVAFEVET